jgi:hypothetical protein
LFFFLVFSRFVFNFSRRVHFDDGSQTRKPFGDMVKILSNDDTSALPLFNSSVPFLDRFKKIYLEVSCLLRNVEKMFGNPPLFSSS